MQPTSAPPPSSLQPPQGSGCFALPHQHQPPGSPPLPWLQHMGKGPGAAPGALGTWAWHCSGQSGAWKELPAWVQSGLIPVCWDGQDTSPPAKPPQHPLGMFGLHALPGAPSTVQPGQAASGALCPGGPDQPGAGCQRSAPCVLPAPGRRDRDVSKPHDLQGPTNWYPGWSAL